MIREKKHIETGSKKISVENSHKQKDVFCIEQTSG